MIPIDFGSDDERISVEEIHRKTLRNFVATRIVNECHCLCSISDPDVRAYIGIISQTGFENCLTLSVDGMRELVRSVDVYLPQGAFYRKREKLTPKEAGFKKANEVLAKIFDYDYFSKMEGDWNLGKLALRLSRYVRVCPYCNAETVYAYKVRVKEGDAAYVVKKSAFDHYFPKARYPFLAVSLYNLIPACTRCNTGFKSDRHEELLNMAHPYAKDESIDDGLKFRMTFKKSHGFLACQTGDVDAIVLSKRCVGPSFIKGDTWERTFRLSDTYTALYKEDACDALNRALMYRPSRVNFMLKKFNEDGLVMSRGQLERILFGAEIDRSKINITRMGKLINDIYETFCHE